MVEGKPPIPLFRKPRQAARGWGPDPNGGQGENGQKTLVVQGPYANGEKCVSAQGDAAEGTKTRCFRMLSSGNQRIPPIMRRGLA